MYSKAIFYTCIILAWCTALFGQNVPDNNYTIPNALFPPQPTPAPYTPALKENSVITRTAKEALQTLQDIYNVDIDKVDETREYFDGLGRGIQSVQRKASPDNTTGEYKDILAIKAYDNLGREPLAWLPFAADHTASGFRNDAFQLQNAFNSTTFPGENFFYSETKTENATNGRPLKMLAQGNSWIGNDRGTSLVYTVNNDKTDHVYFADFLIPALHHLPSGAQFQLARYHENELSKNKSIDEDGHVGIEFKNKTGQIVMKRTYAHTGAELEQTKEKSACNTLYVYDTKGQLRLVVQPKAYTAMVANGGILYETVLDEGCFMYDYDGYGRMIAKKVPGAAWIYMVYDNRDRLVLTQDGNLRDQKLWTYIQYNNLDKTVESGLADPGNMNFESLRDL